MKYYCPFFSSALKHCGETKTSTGLLFREGEFLKGASRSALKAGEDAADDIGRVWGLAGEEGFGICLAGGAGLCELLSGAGPKECLAFGVGPCGCFAE